jgi:hypothetical protein
MEVFPSYHMISQCAPLRWPVLQVASMCVSPMDHDTSLSRMDASPAFGTGTASPGVHVAPSSDGDTPPRPDVRVVKLAALAARG